MSFETRKRLLAQYLSSMVRRVVSIEVNVGVKVGLPIVAGPEGLRQCEFRLERPTIGAEIKDPVWMI